MSELSYNQISELTGKAFRTVKKRLDQAGVNPIRKEGNALLFDSQVALPAIYKQQVIDMPGGEDGTNYSELNEYEKYRKLKRENDTEEKKLEPVEKFKVAWESASSVVVPILESLPLMIKRNWPEVTGDQILLIKKSVAECRNAVADSGAKLAERLG